MDYQQINSAFNACCERKDLKDALPLAARLIDLYGAEKREDGVLSVALRLTASMGDGANDLLIKETASVLILKRAVAAAVSLLKSVDELPEPIGQMIPSAAMLFCWLLPIDEKFALDQLEEIQSLAKVDTPRQPIYAAFFSLMEISLAATGNMAEYTDGFPEAKALLNGNKKPERYLTEIEKIVSMKTKKSTSMIRRADAFADDIIVPWYQYMLDGTKISSTLRRRHRKLLSAASKMGFSHNSLLFLMLIGEMCDFQTDLLSKSKMNELIAEFEEACREGSYERWGCNYIAFSRMLEMIAMYYEERRDDPAAAFRCNLMNLNLVTDWHLRLLFEADKESSVDLINLESRFCLNLLHSLVEFLEGQPSEENIRAFYTAMCRRKNLIFTIEQMERYTTGITSAAKVLDREILFGDICSAIPQDAVLIDLFYAPNIDLTGIGEADDALSAEEIWQCNCYAIVLDHTGNCKLENLGLASTLGGLQRDDFRWMDPKPEEWKDTLRSVNKLYGRSESEKNIQRMARAMHLYEYVKELTERLLAGHENKQRIFVCTEGAFNGASFLSLPYKDGYIVDCFAVRNIANIYDILHPRIRSAANRALVLSAPEYGPGNLEPLKGSEVEGEQLKRLLQRQACIPVDALSGDAARRDPLLNLLHQNHYQILHFSTHGGFGADNRLFMALAGANRSSDALLYEDEIIQMVSGGGDMTILSLCYAGAIDQQIQNSLSGFFKSFLLVGTSSVIAPIMKTQDNSSAVFFNLFYRIYLESEEPIEIVLRKAICQLREMYPQFADFNHWAPWVCYSAAADYF